MKGGGMDHDYDVVVIGAGINGAGVAQAAAAAGYSVLVLEQFDGPAQGTSSKSSKLIHGGLRYLETGQFHLVHESLRERAILLRNAPHLVRLVPFHIPVYRQTSRRPWKIMAGLAVYSLFSRKPFRRVPRSQWNRLDGIKTRDLDAVFSYYDAQTDDAKLTCSVLASAQALGAEVLTNTGFESGRLAGDGCEITYRTAAVNKTVSARVLVNTAGPWVNDVLQRIRPAPKMMAVSLVQGTHIIVPGKISHPYYLESPRDGRAVYVTPWKGRLLIGTTENEYTGDPAKVAPLESEIGYLLEIYNHYFAQNLDHSAVVKAFAGVRVLPGGGGAAFRKSRETHFSVDKKMSPGVLTVYGGKLTAYRATSAKVMQRINKSLPHRSAIADTKNLLLPDVG